MSLNTKTTLLSKSLRKEEVSLSNKDMVSISYKDMNNLVQTNILRAKEPSPMDVFEEREIVSKTPKSTISERIREIL